MATASTKTVNSIKIIKASGSANPPSRLRFRFAFRYADGSINP